MAKYIGTYPNVAAVTADLAAQNLSRPFVVLTQDNDRVLYGPKLDLAKVGDIAVYSVAADQIYYIKKANYNTTTYPTASYVPIGVVCKNQEQSVTTGVSEDVKVMNLKWLSAGHPDSGEDTKPSYKNMMTSCTNLTNIIQSASVEAALITDIGRANNDSIIEQVTTPADWKTANTLTSSTDGSRGIPYVLAWRWHTAGTERGDWYIPSAYDLANLSNSDNREILNESFTAVGGSLFDVTDDGVYGYRCCTSSFCNNNLIFLGTNSFFVDTYWFNALARCILSLSITELV